MTVMHWTTVDTPDGPFTVVADPDGAVRASGWASLDDVVAKLPPRERPLHLDRRDDMPAAVAVRRYYDGDIAAIDAVRVRQTGTELRTLGWDTLRTITPGAPWTYSEFAEALGRPTAVRAAASVCANNRCALFVPCHRVVGKGGAITGFAWGVDVKRSLLEREAAAGA